MIISIGSQKGGTGKTTTSVTLAAGLAMKGKKVLLVDMDSQADSSKVLLENYLEIPPEQTLFRTIIEKQPLAIHDSHFSGVNIVPSHIYLSSTDKELTTAIDNREKRLKEHLDSVKDHYDYIIIDCPPSLGWLTINAFTASDKVLAIVSPGYFELASLGKLLEFLDELKYELRFNPQLELLGMLFTMSDPTVNSANSLNILRQTYGDKVLKTVIPKNTDIRDSHFSKRSIFDFSPSSKSAIAYGSLIEELGL